MNYFFPLLLASFAFCCNCQMITPFGNVCIDQQVETQCEVNGSSLTWRVFYANGTQYRNDVSFTSFSSGISNISEGEFIFELLSKDSLIRSRILFTALSSFNGYSVSCQDNNMNTFRNLTIIVQDNPGDIIIHTDTFTDSSVNISWTESPPYCNTTYEYNVSSSALEENIIMNSTSNSVIVEGLVPSYNQYCTVVTAKDQYSVRQSDKSCFIFNVPSQVRNLTLTTSTNGTCITAIWDKPVILDIDGLVVPELLSYTVSIANSATPNDYINETKLSPAHTSTSFCYNIEFGQEYIVKVTAINGVGGNTSSNTGSTPMVVSSVNFTPGSSSILSSSFQSNNGSNSSSILPSSVSPSTSGNTITTISSVPDSGEVETNIALIVIASIVASIVIIIIAPTIIIITILIITGYIKHKRLYSQPPQPETTSNDDVDNQCHESVEMAENVQSHTVNDT